MKNLAYYRFSCENAIFNFLKNKDKEIFFADLDRIEGLMKKEFDEVDDLDKCLCLRFGESNTIIYTLSEIKKDISIPTVNNYDFLIDQFIDVTKDFEPELQVYFA